MTLEGIPTDEEFAEQYRKYAHISVSRYLLHKQIIRTIDEYAEEYYEVVEMVLSGVLRIASEQEIDKMRKEVQELLDPITTKK